MKKIVIALFASIALVLGSGALVTGASAAEPRDDYPASVPVQPGTPTVPSNPPKAGAPIRIVIPILAGNVKVSGKIRVRFNGKTYWFKVNNGVANIKLPSPKGKSKYKNKKVSYEFKPYTGSIFKGAKGSTKVPVGSKKK